MHNDDLYRNDELREHVLAWLRSNSIDPNDIVADAVTSLVGDQLTTEVFLRNDAGRIQFDPAEQKDGRERVARETKTFTVTAPPPPDVAAWLRPRCPECGR